MEHNPNCDRPTEDALAADLESRLLSIGSARCSYRRELRIRCPTLGEPRYLRIDFVVKLDGLLLGIEGKAPPQRAAELGQDLVQCADYAKGCIAPAPIERVPPKWIDQHMVAVFLASDGLHSPQFVRDHAFQAHRLFGPANVGFLVRRRGNRLIDTFELFLCADRVWSLDHGWHRGIEGRTHRLGNGSTRAASFADISYYSDSEQ